MRHLVWSGLAAVLLVAPSPQLARASSTALHDIQSLAQAADEVVVAEVREAQPEALRGMIVTRVLLEVTRAVAGQCRAGDPLEVLLPGGELQGVGMLVPGAPRLEVGRQYLLFLADRRPLYAVIGLAHGALLVEEGSDPSRPLAQATTALPGSWPPPASRPVAQLSPGVLVPLQHLLADIDEARHGL